MFLGKNKDLKQCQVSEWVRCRALFQKIEPLNCSVNGRPGPIVYAQSFFNYSRNGPTIRVTYPTVAYPKPGGSRHKRTGAKA